MSVSFDSLCLTAVTLPGLAVLGVMAAYYLRQRFGGGEPREWRYVLMALLLPLVILMCNWPARSGYYGYSHDYSGERTVLLCFYGVFYAVGLLIYALGCNVLEQYRPKVFNFFFFTLAIIVMMSLFAPLVQQGMLLPFMIGLLFLVYLLYEGFKTARQLLSGPHGRIMGWMMVFLFPGCAIASYINVWYVPLFAFWVWVTVQSIIWNKPPDKCEMQAAAVGTSTPSPSPPSPDID